MVDCEWGLTITLTDEVDLAAVIDVGAVQRLLDLDGQRRVGRDDGVQCTRVPGVRRALLTPLPRSCGT
jgi:hypothetical protein